MKHTHIFLVMITLSALAGCKDERPKVNNTEDITHSEYVNIVCYDGVKYILYDKGITAKINETSRIPERCSE